MSATGFSVRHAGSPKAVTGRSAADIAAGLRNGVWDPTDEVRGPSDGGVPDASGVDAGDLFPDAGRPDASAPANPEARPFSPNLRVPTVGCACGQTGGPEGWLWLLCLVAWRRRRDGSRPGAATSPYCRPGVWSPASHSGGFSPLTAGLTRRRDARAAWSAVRWPNRG